MNLYCREKVGESLKESHNDFVARLDCWRAKMVEVDFIALEYVQSLPVRKTQSKQMAEMADG